MSVPPPTPLPTLSEPTQVKAEPDTNEASQNLNSEQLSEWQSLRQRVEENPYNTTAWEDLVENAEQSGDQEKVKEAYESLLLKFPNTASAQIAYLTHFLANSSTFPFAESLFARFLRTSPSVDLWKFYIVYVRRVNSGPSTRETVRKAYEFALSHVGQDKDSGEIWNEYIQFLKAGETSTTWEEQQKMDALRKVYHRAVQIPLENVETLWKDYEAFENGLNKITAKKFMTDLSPAHMTAKSQLRELRKHVSLLFPPAPVSTASRKPLQLPHKPSYNQADRALVGAWKQYLKWEESNPLEIEDKPTLIARLQGVYRKAVIRMRFFSEIWFMAHSWTASVGRQEDASSLLRAGIEANPTSFVLNFALAETLELAKSLSEVHSLYERLLQKLHEELEEIESRASDDPGVPGPPPMSSASTNGPMSENGFDGVNGSSLPHDASFATQKSESSASTSAKSKELANRRREFGLVYIMYIRFSLRAEGVDASRATFAKARKDKWTPWEVFEAAALMEYHVAKQPTVANKILGLAHQRFPEEIDFVIRYLTFLMSVNDENNARALFERAVTSFSPDKSRPLWERWARYEYQYGSLEAALKLEKRMAEAFPNDPPIKRFAQRHSYLNIDGIANRDLGFAVSKQLTLARTDTVPTVLTGASSWAGPSSSQSPLQLTSSMSSKRQSSPDRLACRDDGKSGEHASAPPYKRARDVSPVRDRDRDRDRWPGPGKDRRFGSPAWDRDRERERSPARRVVREKEKEEVDKVVLPQVISGFIGTLPTPGSFDGPIFRTDDLLQLFRNAVIPGSSASRPRSPPPPPRPTRPPPDYGPYQGPGRGGRRY